MAAAKQADLAVFLEAYKTLENTLRDAENLDGLSWYDGNTVPATIAELEDGTISDEYKNKLRLCRNVRNYAQHNQGAENFVIVSQAMVAFLKERTRDIQVLKGTAKDIMTKCSAKITAKSTLAEAAGAFQKPRREWYPVVDDEGKFVVALELWVVLQCMNIGITPKTKMAKLLPEHAIPKVRIIPQATPIQEIRKMDGEKIVVTTQTGRVVGTI